MNCLEDECVCVLLMGVYILSLKMYATISIFLLLCVSGTITTCPPESGMWKHYTL